MAPYIIIGPGAPPAIPIAAQALIAQELPAIPEAAAEAADTLEEAILEEATPEAAATAAAAAADADN